MDELLIQKWPALPKKYNVIVKCSAAFLWSLVMAAFAQASFKFEFDPDVPYTLQTFGIFLGSFWLGEYLPLAAAMYLAEGIFVPFLR